MKKYIIAFLLVICLCTLFGCDSYNSNKATKPQSSNTSLQDNNYQNSTIDNYSNKNDTEKGGQESTSSIIIQTLPDSYIYSFNSYNDLSKALVTYDYFTTSDLDNYGDLFAKTITSFYSKTVELYIPSINEDVCQLRNKEGFSNISLMTTELYNLPWICYHCKVNESYVDIKLAYPSVIGSNEINHAKTYREVLSVIAPNAPNPDNYTKYDSYENIYETELTLANDRIVEAMISELKNSNKVYVMFDFDGLLVSIYADNQILLDSFWSSFALVRS